MKSVDRYLDDLFYFERDDDPARRPPLLLIHGAGGTHLNWPPNLRRISGQRVLALDLPGHGRSGGNGERSIAAYAGRILGFLDAHGLERAVLGGHSMGSAIALWVALEHPGRIAALILVGAGARMGVNPIILGKASVEATFREAVSLVTQYSFSRESPSRLVELAEKRMAETPRPVLYGDLLACDAFDVEDRLGEIGLPTLIVYGEDDRMTPLRSAHYLAEGLPKARLEVVPRAGHIVMLEQPERVGELVGGFLGHIQPPD